MEALRQLEAMGERVVPEGARQLEALAGAEEAVVAEVPRQLQPLVRV